MNNLVGTILSVEDFLVNEDRNIQIETMKVENSGIIMKLPVDRVYKIPYYQREYRWTEKNVRDLMLDVKTGDKFLGNVILSKEDEHNFSILDGQQRLTTILLILYYLKLKFPDNFTVLNVIKLRIENFLAFETLKEADFTEEKLSIDDKKKVDENDPYHQKRSYIDIWKAIDETELLINHYDAGDFYRNLINSNLNIIIDKSRKVGTSIRYFLDVNIKGLQLDTEDIFKGFLFSQNEATETQEGWNRLKDLSFRLKENTDVEFGMMKMIECYLHCELYSFEEGIFSNVSFGEKFLLKDDFTLKDLAGGRQRKHLEGEHILSVIHNNKFTNSMLEKLQGFIELLIEISGSPTCTQGFKGRIHEKGKNKIVDDETVESVYFFIRQIVLGKEVAPKIFVMKYYLDVLQGDSKTKQDIKKMYGIYVCATIFSMLASRKGVSVFATIFKKKNWYDEVLEHTQSYFERGNITKSKVIASYKYVADEESDASRYECMKLAIIYNYFQVTKSGVYIKKGENKNLLSFVNNKEKYSIEHFIVNESLSYKVARMEEKYASRGLSRYANSIFNYIFCDRIFNSEELVNNLFDIKIDKLEENIDKLECKYSRMVLKQAKKYFLLDSKKFEKMSETEIEAGLNKYFKNDFGNEFFDFASAIITELLNHIGKELMS